jgi:hypothetical protein
MYEASTTDHAPAANSTPALAMRPREAAAALGISPRLLWQLTKDGVIPCVRVGVGKRKTILYPIPILQKWLADQAQTPKVKLAATPA